MLRFKLAYSSGFSRKLIHVIGILMLVSISCNVVSEDDNVESGPVPFEVLGQSSSGSADVEYPCRLNASTLDTNHSGNELSAIELTITRPEDFEAHILCNEGTESPDFDHHFILAGLSTLQPHCVYTKKQDVYLSKGTLVYEVTIGDMDCTMPDRASYIVMIPNKYRNAPVNFLIRKNE